MVVNNNKGTCSDIKSFEIASLCLGSKFRNILIKLPNDIKKIVTEIRVRIDNNIVINIPKISYYLQIDGSVSQKKSNLCASQRDIDEIFQIICNHSVYSYQNQIKNGFITFRGGHRIGLCGTAVIDHGEIVNVKNISSVNIRIAREIPNCSEEIFKIFNTIRGGMLIIGAPSTGKTTILRDIGRKLSENLNCVTIVDERGEISGIFDGKPQFDIGSCDILNGFPKYIGISHAIRVLSPQIIICDEIGTDEDIFSIENALNSGVTMICSIHARNIDEFLKKPQAKRLILSGAFQSFIVLDANKLCKISNFFNLERLNFTLSQNEK